jgi:hypothetical protein
MKADSDLGLDPAQWETLKALGAPDPEDRRVNEFTCQQLVISELAAMRDGRPAITPKGRKVVLRGPPRLWDPSA